MIDLVALFEKLYAVRFVFSRRFLLCSLVTVSGMIYGALGFGDLLISNIKPFALGGIVVIALLLWWQATIILPYERRRLRIIEKLVDEFRLDKAGKLLEAPPYFFGYPARVAYLKLLIRFKRISGDLVSAYDCLMRVEQMVLLPREKQGLYMEKAALLFAAGNYTGFRKTLSAIDCEVVTKDKPLHFSYLFLQSNLEELSNIANGKALLEEAIEKAVFPVQRAMVYNNLARMEDAQGLLMSARGSYEHAWSALEENPIPRLFPIIGHNLLLNYACTGEIEKALTFLQSYRCLVDKNNSQQLLQFFNDQTHLARQLHNRELLLDAYKGVKKDVLPFLTESEKFSVEVSELRMRFSDDVRFVEHFDAVINRFPEIKLFKEEDRLNALRELWAVYKQSKEFLPHRLTEMAMPLIVDELLSMEGCVDKHLRDISPLLPAQRDIWLNCKIELVKIKIYNASLTGKPIPKKLIEILFNFVQERSLIWAEKGNDAQELNALIICCDEYVSYSSNLDPSILVDYREQAFSALTQAGIVLDRSWPHPSIVQYSLGYAYFLWKIAGDAEKARVWLMRFESRNHSLLHYMGWLRVQYAELKSAIC